MFDPSSKKENIKISVFSPDNSLIVTVEGTVIHVCFFFLHFN